MSDSSRYKNIERQEYKLQTGSNDLIHKIDKVFDQIDKPSVIYISSDEQPNPSQDLIDIQNDFSSLSKYDLDYFQSSMMICDSALLKDETVLYFLPRLVRNVFLEGGDECLLWERLKRIPLGSLNEIQRNVFDELLEKLRELNSN